MTESTLPTFRLLTDRELSALPEPEWTVGGILPAGSLAVMYGQPGDGKSFLALDIALSVATQPTWHGHATKGGAVVYVAAGEGASGLSRRVDAWKHVHDLEEIPGALFLTSPVQLHLPAEVYGFCRAMDSALEQKPALIVLDTLARCMVGADENSARDMGQAIAGADHLRQHTGAAVLLPHHPQKNGNRERGSSALYGAADTVWQLKNDDDTRLLECKKQKDAELFDKHRFVLQPVRESCVLALAGGPVRSGKLTPNQCKLLEALHATDCGTGVAPGIWQKSAEVAEGSFYRVLKELKEDLGLVRESRGKYSLTTQGAECAIKLSEPRDSAFRTRESATVRVA